MPPVGFEPTISAGERSETYASDCAATGTGNSLELLLENTTINHVTPDNSLLSFKNYKIPSQNHCCYLHKELQLNPF